MKVGIVHDWLNGMRGGEIVLESILKLFPESTIYTLFHDKGSVSKKIESHQIVTSFIQHIPLRKRYYRYLLPIFPYAVESFNLKDCDLVISISHCVAKGVITPPDTLHIAYILTPMRYAWDMFTEYFNSEKGVKKLIIDFFITQLREWDVSSSIRVDHFVAISSHVAKRIRKYYRRNCDIIHPPVYTHRFKVKREHQDFYLIVSAIAPYKKVELAIEAFKHNKKTLIIIGGGQEEKKIKKMCESTDNIKFLGWQRFEVVKEYMENCKAFILPGEEDFGIAPVEAMACGKPVIAYGKGGIRDTVIPLGESEPPTGVFFYSQNSEALNEAIDELEKRYSDFDPYLIRKRAELFSEERFIEEFSSYIKRIREVYNGGKKGFMEGVV